MTNETNNTTQKQILVNFHIGRGGRFNNPGHLYFEGIGTKRKEWVENDNFTEYENEVEIRIEHGDDIIDLITDLDNQTEGSNYIEFCEKYGNLGGLLLMSCDGNEIGEYTAGEANYYYDIDGSYETYYGRLISSFEDLTDKEMEAIKASDYCSDLEEALEIDINN